MICQWNLTCMECWIRTLSRLTFFEWPLWTSCQCCLTFLFSEMSEKFPYSLIVWGGLLNSDWHCGSALETLDTSWQSAFISLLTHLMSDLTFTSAVTPKSRIASLYDQPDATKHYGKTLCIIRLISWCQRCSISIFTACFSCIDFMYPYVLNPSKLKIWKWNPGLMSSATRTRTCTFRKASGPLE